MRLSGYLHIRVTQLSRNRRGGSARLGPPTLFGGIRIQETDRMKSILSSSALAAALALAGAGMAAAQTSGATGGTTRNQTTMGQSTTGQSTTGQSTTGQSTTGQSTMSQSTMGQSKTGHTTTSQTGTSQTGTGQTSMQGSTQPSGKAGGLPPARASSLAATMNPKDMRGAGPMLGTSGGTAATSGPASADSSSGASVGMPPGSPTMSPGDRQDLRMSQDEVRKLLSDQGYNDVSDISRDGNVFHARAMRDGRQVSLNVDAYTGTVRRQQAGR